ncbi:hypothetical protein QVD17_05868 [Tagetes erecta]|uniref:Uncharacterized protein n=1 Tax=Tagetes erecta TaxID=13708 RepID=A0AAD8PAV6_TARER|nr:hypothetical protein QVD17_05868 [Tagetes erecta]
MVTELTKKRAREPNPFGNFFLSKVIRKSEDIVKKEDAIISQVDQGHVGLVAVGENVATAMLAILFKHTSIIIESINLEIEKSKIEKAVTTITEAMIEIIILENLDPIFHNLHVGCNSRLWFRTLVKEFGEENEELPESQPKIASDMKIMENKIQTLENALEKIKK